MTKEEKTILDVLQERISNWMRMKRILATILLFIEKLRKRRSKEDLITVEDVEESEKLLIKMIQEKHFCADIAILKGNKRQLSKSSQLVRLDPFLDEAGTLRVGGRIRKSSFPDELKHPTILPKRDTVVRRMIEWHHKDTQHLGRTTTLNELRGRGYWVINGNAEVRYVIYRCVSCKLFRGKPCTQKMSDLPESRTISEAPFSYCGIDLFGPFVVKEGRKEIKRYGCIFTLF